MELQVRVKVWVGGEREVVFQAEDGEEEGQQGLAEEEERAEWGVLQAWGLHALFHGLPGWLVGCGRLVDSLRWWEG